MVAKVLWYHYEVTLLRLFVALRSCWSVYNYDFWTFSLLEPVLTLHGSDEFSQVKKTVQAGELFYYKLSI